MVSRSPDRGSAAWLADLEARHLSRLTFPEVRRAVEALSEDYVARRERLEAGRALAGEGKKAAFALFFAPLHFFLVRNVVRALGAASPPPLEIVDLGCGTGVAGAAWALEAGGSAVRGVDRNAWALDEAGKTWSQLGVRGRAIRSDVARAPLPPASGAVIAAFSLNELDAAVRDSLLERLLGAARSGTRILVIEAIAKRPVRWWPEAASRVVASGGRSDEWRFSLELPELQSRLSRAAGMDHRRLSARSLYLSGPGP